MDLELLIKQYLYINKNVSLPGMGKLVLDTTDEPSNDKHEIPLENIHFISNLQEQNESTFTVFVSSKTGKIVPLAEADIESHFILNRQLINIGKPYIIGGIGRFERKDDYSYQFIPGNFSPISELKIESSKKVKHKLNIPVEKKFYKTDKPLRIKKILIPIFIIILFGISAFTAYYFLVLKRNLSTNAIKVYKKNTVPILKDSSTIGKVNIIDTGIHLFKAIFEAGNNKKRIIDRYNRLKIFKTDVSIETKDSVTFKLWVPLNSTFSDTTFKKDSLKRYFGRPIILEKM